MSERLNNPPKYKIDQTVEVIITTKDEQTNLELKNTVNGVISVIKASGNAESDTYEYGITLDMPGCYHNGKPPFTYIMEHNVKIK